MAEQIYTIPINEAFDEYSGCPMCRLRKKLETSSLNYIMGAAMMEPDVRIMTNKTGFCSTHFQKMLKMGNRLSMALTLESHLDTVGALFPDQAELKPGKLGKLRKYSGETPAGAIKNVTSSCFVCQRVADFESHYLSNVVHIWKKDPEFRTKLSNQPYICLEHTALLLDTGKAELSEAHYCEFSSVLMELCHKQLTSLRKNITAFCRSFDHENAGKPLTEDVKKSVESSVAFLSGEFDI